MCTSADAATHAETKTGFAFLPIGKIESDLHRAARIQAGARFAGKARPLQGRGLGETPVPPEKFLPIAGQGARRLVDIDEGDASGNSVL